MCALWKTCNQLMVILLSSLVTDSSCTLAILRLTKMMHNVRYVLG